MKASTKETLATFILVIVVGLVCGFCGFMAGVEKGERECLEALSSYHSWKRGDPIENLSPYLRDEATKICTGSVAIDTAQVTQ